MAESVIAESGLRITMGNSPIFWRFHLDGEELGDVIAVGIYASIDEPVEVHLLRVDFEQFADAWPRGERRGFERQESYVGPAFISNEAPNEP